MTETVRPSLVGEEGPVAHEQAWWQSPFRMFQTNLREPDALMDVETVLDTIEAQGANVWLINAGGIISFYPSELSHQYRNPYLEQRPSGDLLGDAVAAARRRGIRVMARMDFSKVTEQVAASHPEWRYLDPHGNPQIHYGLTSVCPLGAYYQTHSFEAIDEVIDRYGVDGFFFNWFSFNEVDYFGQYRGVCHCEACQAGFAEFSDGANLPDGPEHSEYDRWLEFSTKELAQLAANFRDHVAQAAPGAGLILGQSADIVFHEANNAIGRPLWPFRTDEAVSAHKMHDPAKPVLVNAVSFIDMPYRLAGEQAEHFGIYLVQAIARGAIPSTYIMGVPGDIDYPNLPTAGRITRFHRDNADLYAALEPYGDIALVRPDRLRLSGSAHSDATEEFRGIFLALQEKQRSVDVLGAEDIAKVEADGRLTHAAVVLPDIGRLDERQSAALDGFMRRGGTVVSTGSSAIDADGTTQLADPATQMLSVEDDRERLRNSYIGDVASDEEVAMRQSARMVPVIGSLRIFEWATDSISHGHYVSQAPLGPPEKTYGHTVTEHPAWAERAVGEGRSVRIPFTLGRTYRETALQVVRDFALDVLGDSRRSGLQVETVEQVAVVTGQSENRTVVHLVNMSGLRRQGYGPALPIRETTIRFDGAPHTVTSRMSGALELVPGPANTASATLPELHDFDVVVIDYPEES